MTTIIDVISRKMAEGTGLYGETISPEESQFLAVGIAAGVELATTDLGKKIHEENKTSAVGVRAAKAAAILTRLFQIGQLDPNGPPPSEEKKEEDIPSSLLEFLKGTGLKFEVVSHATADDHAGHDHRVIQGKDDADTFRTLGLAFGLAFDIDGETTFSREFITAVGCFTLTAIAAAHEHPDWAEVIVSGYLLEDAKKNAEDLYSWFPVLGADLGVPLRFVRED